MDPRPLILIAVLCVASSCVRTVSCGPLERAEEVTLNDSGTVRIQDREYVLTPAVGQDLMPGPLKFRHPIAAGVTVRTASEVSLGGVQPVCIRVARDGDSWQTRLDPIEQGTGSDGRSFVSANATSGPEWEASTTVNVTVWLRQDGRLYEVDLGTVTIQAHA